MAQNLISFHCWIKLHCMDVPQFVYSPKDTTKGHFGCVQVLAIKSKAAVNICMQVFLWICFQRIWVTTLHHSFPPVILLWWGKNVLRKTGKFLLQEKVFVEHNSFMAGNGQPGDIASWARSRETTYSIIQTRTLWRVRGALLTSLAQQV